MPLLFAYDIINRFSYDMAHMRTTKVQSNLLICAFVIDCLDRIEPKVSISKIPRHVVEQISLNLIWS